MGNQYIRAAYHFNKEVVEAGEVSVQYVKTEENIADIFTKATSRQTLEKLLPYALGYTQ